MLLILRYADELRKAEPYFNKIEAKADADAVKLATDLIEQESGKFQPEKMPNEYARAVHELVQAKIEQRAPEVEIETAKGEQPKVFLSASASVGALLSHCRIACCSAPLVSCNYSVMSLCYWPT